MSKRKVDAWVCELEGCGHVWLAAGVDPPAKCAKCKRRGWHSARIVATKIMGPVTVAATLDVIDKPVRVVAPKFPPLVAALAPCPKCGGECVPWGSGRRCQECEANYY